MKENQLYKYDTSNVHISHIDLNTGVNSSPRIDSFIITHKSDKLTKNYQYLSFKVLIKYGKSTVGRCTQLDEN